MPAEAVTLDILCDMCNQDELILNFDWLSLRWGEEEIDLNFDWLNLGEGMSLGFVVENNA